MKPNFHEMSLKELRVYVLAHQDDNEAFYAYMDKSKTQGNWFRRQEAEGRRQKVTHP